MARLGPADAAGVVDRIDHDSWSVEARRAPLGVVGFVFEGRPNVFADACGVVRTGNTVVFRIGSDALGTARGSSTWRWYRRYALRGCQRGPWGSSTRRRTLQATHSSPINGSRSRSHEGRVLSSPSSERWHRNPAPR